MSVRVGLVAAASLCLFSLIMPSPVAATGRRVAGCDGRWHRMETVNPGHHGGDFNSLASVVAVSASDVWGVGSGEDFSSGDGFRTLVEHWDGHDWSRVPSPDSSKATWNQLAGVSAVAADDVWAVGVENSGPYQDLIEHWDGTGWSIQDDGTMTAYLTSVAAVSATDVWAAGSTDYIGQGLLLHWDGGTWTRTLIPAPVVFRAVTALGPDDVWAVGQEAVASEGDLTVAVHWDGWSWTRFPTPSPLRVHDIDQNWLTSVTAAGPDDVWATGVARDPDYGIVDTPFTEHWDGLRWSLVPTPDPGGRSADTDLWSSVALSSSDVWAVGSQGTEPDWDTFTIHWDGTGWTEAAPATFGRFLSVDADPGGALWGLGDAVVNHPFRGTATVAEHRC